jgi:uncharacterized membrane protein YuzA (DUF378 family)
MDKKTMHSVAVVLTAVGALNWGLVALLDLNLVHLVVGSWPVVEKIVYVLVGISGLFALIRHFDSKKK